VEENHLTNTKKLFAQRLKKIRADKKLSQEQLGESLGYRNARSDISNIEAGRMLPSLEKVIKLAYDYDVSIDYLIGRKED
jgi:transcriptional regulator with XRE-family HTH domain